MSQIKFCNTIPDVLDPIETGVFFERVNFFMKKALDSGQLSNFGKLYHEFSEKLKTELDISSDKEIVLTSSGHTALMAAYSVSGVKRLLVPCYTYEATRVAATLQGIECKVVDVNKQTGAIDLDLVSKIDVKDYDGIVLVAPLSSIPNLLEYESFCKLNNKKLIIDGAATFGTGNNIYNYGDMYCLSFHATKTFPVGEAGAVICDKRLADDVQRYITFGLDHSKTPSGFGINGKVSEYTCAVGLTLLEIVHHHIKMRQYNAIYLRQRLSDVFGGRVSFLNSWVGPETAHQAFPVYFNCIHNSKPLVEFLLDNGIMTLQYYKPLSNEFPVTVDLFERNVCFPIHSGVSYSDIDFMVKKTMEFIYA